MKRIAVIDIGKTNVKLAVVDLAARVEIAVVTQPNRVLEGPPYPHFDTEGIWAFVIEGLRGFQAAQGIDGISITTHGACGALMAADGGLAAPVLDYEHTGPDDCRAAYEAIRPAFAETGSPALPMGLNLGAQIFWQFSQDGGLADRVAWIATWPQYWGFRLTGERATDVTSLGCHTDLWNPNRGGFSSLPARLGIAGKLAAPRRPGDVLGGVTAEVARVTGLAPGTPVLCGIHDSNASLLPHLIDRAAPFAVVSTGTWVVVMAIGGAATTLDPARDTLINVNARGDPVPSARFMGGREYEMMRGGRASVAVDGDADRVLDGGIMLLPAVVAGCGPFASRRMEWRGRPDGDGEAEVALGYYLALMTAECLAQVGAQGPSIIEGPFAANPWYWDMLAAATERPVVRATSRTGTAIGAALLFEGGVERTVPAEPPVTADPRLGEYARQWRGAVEEG